MKKLIIIVAAVVLTSCGEETGSDTKAVAGTDKTAPENVILMGGDFGAVAFKCHDSVGIYVTKDDNRATSAIAVVPNHEKCVDE